MGMTAGQAGGIAAKGESGSRLLFVTARYHKRDLSKLERQRGGLARIVSTFLILPTSTIIKLSY